MVILSKIESASEIVKFCACSLKMTYAMFQISFVFKHGVLFAKIITFNYVYKNKFLTLVLKKHKNAVN